MDPGIIIGIIGLILGTIYWLWPKSSTKKPPESAGIPPKGGDEQIQIESRDFILSHRQNKLLRHEKGWIEQIRYALKDKGKAVISQVALSGQGGLGKTAMAIEYAYQFWEEYPGGVFWFQMEQGLGMAVIEFIKIATTKGIKFGAWEKLKEPDRIRMVMSFLNQRSKKLVILDNLVDDSLVKFFPTQDTHLMITTRLRSIAFALVEMELPDEMKRLISF